MKQNIIILIIAFLILISGCSRIIPTPINATNTTCINITCNDVCYNNDLLTNGKCVNNLCTYSTVIDGCNVAPVSNGKVYYVSSSVGNDLNNGLTENAPIKTISKVNTLFLSAGDSVLFKRGDTWRLPTDAYLLPKGGNSSWHIIYGAYGIGNKPSFYGSFSGAGANNWVNSGTNIWKTTVTYSKDVGHIMCDNTLIGAKRFSIGNLTAFGDFYYGTDKYLYVYSTSNPGILCNKLEIAGNKGSHIISFDSKSYITFANLSLSYGGDHGFSGSTTHDIKILDCDIRYIGGQILGATGSVPPAGVRYGNCIQFGCMSDNILVKGNSVDYCFDSALTPQAWDTCRIVTISNQEWSYNIVKHSRYGFELFNNLTTNAETTNILVDHNTFINDIGSYTTYETQVQYTGRDIQLSRSPANTHNITITNNIFYNPRQYTVNLAGTGPHYNWHGDYPFLDYNLYYDATYPLQIKWEQNTYTSIAGLQTKGVDVHGKQFNPLFDISDKPSGAACTMSSTGSYVGAVPCK